jgi:DNA polymerase/3'-5' exonuclease PolX
VSDKQKFRREAALKVAWEIYDKLHPLCERIEIAGSIRRHQPFVSDIEILYVPVMDTVKVGLFAGDVVQSDRASAGLITMLTAGYLKERLNSNGSQMWGAKNKLAVHVDSGIPVDFFATTIPNWWVSLVIRTGGKRTNLALTMGANKRGLTLNAYGSGFTKLTTGEKIVCTSEREVFEHAGVRFVDPEFRQ